MSYDNLLLHTARAALPERISKSAFRKYCRRNRGQQAVAQLKHGHHMHVVLGDSVDNRIFVYQDYEPETTAVFKQLAQRCDHLLDVGCNIGYFACLFAQLRPSSRILAYDPNPAMTTRTARNLTSNGHENHSVVNAGLASSSGELELNIPENRHSLASFAYEPDGRRGGAVRKHRVPVTTLDIILAGEGLANVLLKVDTEGFEFEVFKGLSPTQAAAVDAVVFEYSAVTFKRAGVDMTELFSFEWMQDFKLFRIGEHQLLPTPMPLDPSTVGEFETFNLVLVRNTLSLT